MPQTDDRLRPFIRIDFSRSWRTVSSVVPDDDPLDDRFATIVRELRAEPGEGQTLDRAVVIATELIDGCDCAGVTLIHDKGTRVETTAATSDLAARGDQLQVQLDEGPCLSSAREHETTICRDLANEPRWPQWGPRVVDELGVRSMLCFQLFTTEQSYGALNLYSTSVDAFDEMDEVIGLALAAHVAVALASARDLQNRDLAIVRRTTIGQAEGILMERFRITQEVAFAILRRVSQKQNRKLFDISHEVVHGPRPARS